jgi:hypothetical protein
MNAKNPLLQGALPALCALAALMSGCAADDELSESADFGDSVRHTIALQTASPGAAGTGLDGIKAGAALREYQKDVASPKSAEQPLTINISQ